MVILLFIFISGLYVLVKYIFNYISGLGVVLCLVNVVLLLNVVLVISGIMVDFVEFVSVLNESFVIEFFVIVFVNYMFF